MSRLLPAWTLLGWVVRGLVLAATVGLLLGGVLFLGHLAVAHLRQQEEFKFRFAAIDCPAPAAMTRGDFLDEVQYLSDLPVELSCLEDDLPRLLAEAFARHPWVERVERVQVFPPDRVQVWLRFRTPVLAVPWDGRLRAVDGRGILLPASAPGDGLPVYSGTPRPPQGPAGTEWGDPAVQAAARAQAERAGTR